MAQDVQEIRLGHCDLTLGSLDLGHTKGGVEITISHDILEVKVDKYGSSPAKAFNIGMRMEIKTTLSQYSYDLLTAVLPQATKVEGTGMTPHDALTIGSVAGAEIAGQELTCHPIDQGASTDDDVVVHSVIVIGDVKLPFKIDEETAYEVTLLALIDETQDEGELIAKFGTETGA